MPCILSSNCPAYYPVIDLHIIQYVHRHCKQLLGIVATFSLTDAEVSAQQPLPCSAARGVLLDNQRCPAQQLEAEVPCSTTRGVLLNNQCPALHQKCLAQQQEAEVPCSTTRGAQLDNQRFPGRQPEVPCSTTKGALLNIQRCPTQQPVPCSAPEVSCSTTRGRCALLDNQRCPAQQLPCSTSRGVLLNSQRCLAQQSVPCSATRDILINNQWHLLNNQSQKCPLDNQRYPAQPPACIVPQLVHSVVKTLASYLPPALTIPLPVILLNCWSLCIIRVVRN